MLQNSASLVNNVQLFNERISSPYATGGGGIKLEHEIGALYLAALLAEDIPPGIGAGTIQKIQFQALHTGMLVDDLVITTMDGKTERLTAYQIKHSLMLSDCDSDFKAVGSSSRPIFKDPIKDLDSPTSIFVLRRGDFMLANQYSAHLQEGDLVAADPYYDHIRNHNLLSRLSKANNHTTLPIALYIREL